MRISLEAGTKYCEITTNDGLLALVMFRKAGMNFQSTFLKGSNVVQVYGNMGIFGINPITAACKRGREFSIKPSKNSLVDFQALASSRKFEPME